MSLLELNNLVKHFPVRKGFFGRAKEVVHAVNGVSLSVGESEILGLVGESGSGKSTLGKLVLGLYPPTSGDVIFDGVNIARANKLELKNIRRSLQVVFQDPFSSLNPRMSVGDIISEPLIIHNMCSHKERFRIASELLCSVGLDPDFVHRYPHEFSGGQRQRICIARAISIKPKFIVADEPVSSLDVAVQADVLALLKELQHRHAVSYLFISHDLRVVSKLCDRIAVMYLGKVVEIFPAAKLREAGHPYTLALLSAVPVADPKIRKKREVLKGDIPSPVDMPSGCVFHGRCPFKEDVCEREEPVLENKESGRSAACHFYDKIKRGSK